MSRAVEHWRDALIELGARNTLLYFKELRAGTLSLDEADSEQVAKLLGGVTVKLSQLFPDDHTDAARRCRAIRAKARENYEERGLETLQLAWGFATWDTSRTESDPNAPVLLAAAELKPVTVGATDFSVEVVAEEWEFNPNLAHALASDFGVEIDLERLGSLAIGEVGAQTRMAIDSIGRGVPGFSVAEGRQLANLSYAKLPLVTDLEEGLEEGFLETHEMVSAIAGDELARDLLRERYVAVDPGSFDYEPPENEFLVLDADSSQSVAIATALGGADVVVEGPPGTGKSQTIANLIATHIAEQKRVLFVAEKRAAIEAVIKRLEQVGLGGLVLDLHGGKIRPKQLYEELRESLAIAARSRAAPEDLDAIHAALAQHRSELCQWRDVVHDTRAPWQVSVFKAQGLALAVPPGLRMEVPLPTGIVEQLVPERRAEVASMLRRYVQLEGPRIQGETLSTALEAGALGDADAAESVWRTIQACHLELLPAAREALLQLDAAGRFSPSTSIAMGVAHIQLAESVAATLEVFEPAVFDMDLDELLSQMGREQSGALGRFGGRLVDSSYRRARKAVRGCLRSRLAGPELYAALDAARGQRDEWRALSRGEPAPSFLDELPSARQSVDALIDALALLEDRLRVELPLAAELDVTAARVGALHALRDDLFSLPELTAIRERLCAQEGLRSLLSGLDAESSAGDVELMYQYVWASAVLERCQIDDRHLGGFRGPDHSATVAAYQAEDRRHIEQGATRVLHRWSTWVSGTRSEHQREDEILLHQVNLKRPRKRLRALLDEAPHVATALRPCWVMSPLSVAQVLPRRRDLFDVVVFDEASQIQPADAVCSLTRAPRAVVAGDPKQLPPTSFFASTAQGLDDEDDEEEGGAQLSLAEGLESLLDQVGVLLPKPHGTKTLDWHYRSRDERLITFSNAQPELYDWRLVTFPGVVDDAISHELVHPQGLPKRAATSREEVERVVELVLYHAATRPTETLGIIAMGVAHANAIEERLRERLNEEEQLSAFFAEEGVDEPWFVKNLERVQGDERDAIILSVGYTKTPDGRMNYNFGPITQEGGHRRLNVAATRARRRMTVVSAFGSGDMDPRRLNNPGPRMLQGLLAFAESEGKELVNTERRAIERNPFERDVEEALAAAGIPLTPQLGSAGYFIDLAAHHPDFPGEYVLAIECDGARYHSSPTARDRDRLRQDHLERLGWTFHRIWSTEWFRRREQEIERAVTAWHEAVNRADAQRDRTVDRSRSIVETVVEDVDDEVEPTPGMEIDLKAEQPAPDPQLDGRTRRAMAEVPGLELIVEKLEAAFGPIEVAAGEDAMIDLSGDVVFARFRTTGAVLEAREVEAVRGPANRRRSLLISPQGTRIDDDALEWAHRFGIGLFRLNAEHRPVAVNPPGEALLREFGG